MALICHPFPADMSDNDADRAHLSKAIEKSSEQAGKGKTAASDHRAAAKSVRDAVQSRHLPSETFGEIRWGLDQFHRPKVRSVLDIRARMRRQGGGVHEPYLPTIIDHCAPLPSPPRGNFTWPGEANPAMAVSSG